MALRNQNLKEACAEYKSNMTESSGVDQNRRQLNNVLRSVLRQVQSENLDGNLVDRVQYRLDWIYCTVVRYVDLGIVDERVVNCIRLANECLQQNSGSNGNTSQLAVETVFTGERGRPRLQIPLEQLVFLLEKKFKVDEIAKLFITSKRTVERRMHEFGLSAGNFYTSLSDEQLDAVITGIQRDFPNVGCKRITGLLRTRGIHMQQARMRQPMRRVDPDGSSYEHLKLTSSGEDIIVLLALFPYGILTATIN